MSSNLKNNIIITFHPLFLHPTDQKSNKLISSQKLTLETANLRSESQLRDAIKKLQKYAGIPETGHIDAKTRMLMKAPRCGVPDFDESDFTNRFKSRTRFRRFVAHESMKWSHLNLTWRYD